MTTERTVSRGEVDLRVTDYDGDGPAVILLHGLAGSAHELRPTADALAADFHILLMDQRGHRRSTRRPDDLSRRAFTDDVAAVIEALLPGQQVTLVGQSMGAHTAFLTAAARPDLIDRLVMMEGHPQGNDQAAEEARRLGGYFASWPIPFADVDDARRFLGDSPFTQAAIDDLKPTPEGLRPRFDPDIMQRTIAAVFEPRWAEWEGLTVPTLAVFAEHGLFPAAQRDELISRRPATRRVDLPGAGHDAHLDAFDLWARTLRDHLLVRL